MAPGNPIKHLPAGPGPASGRGRARPEAFRRARRSPYQAASVVSSVGAPGPFFLIDSIAFLAEALLE